MSYDIESRVVEMRFDNKQFEQNASTTMSTLDKLKAKLNFSGASKGLENVGSAAKNVNMASLGNAVETVSARFSAMDVIGVTALANITNSAVNAGKRMLSALTIDPIKTGFQEYETQINAVQTILANTSSKGTTIDEVNEALEQLNKYADMTIYNFTEMTRNIGTFTAAGVDLDTSVAAIQGIANLAAVSGSTSQQASTAMYQLSQALATGTVKLQDWNSVVNAGMGGEVFQNALIRTAAMMDGAADNVEAWKKKNIDSFGSFRDSLTQGQWLTTDVLTQTLNQFTMAAEEGSDTWNEYKKVLMDTGYTEKQATEILKMANTATDAATKVKTFTQLWDVMKESAQSGWSQTWKLLVGDFEQAKAILTPLADFFTSVIGKISDFRNNILENALTRKFSGLIEGVGAAVKVVAAPAAKAAEAVKKTVHSLEELSSIADKVIHGDFGNGVERFNALTEAGINYYAVQNMVNEKLGDSFRHSEEVVNGQYELLGMQGKVTESTEEQASAVGDLTEEQIKNIAKMTDYSDATLRAYDYTEDQIAAFKQLKAIADQLGISVEDLLKNVDNIDGRWLMIESFKNFGNGLIDIFTVLKDAWVDAFPIKSIEEYGQALFNALAAVHRFSVGFKNLIRDGDNYTETGLKLLRTLKGVFAIIDIIATVVGGVFKVAFKVAFKVISEVLGRFGLSLLDVTAAIGDFIVGVRDWIDAMINSSGVIGFLVDVVIMAVEFISELIQVVKESDEFKAFCNYITTAAEALRKFFGSISGSQSFANLVDVLSQAGTAIRDWVTALKTSEDIPGDIIAGLVKGITEGAPKVLGAIFDLAKHIIDGICEALGIHSPSTVMIAIGGYIIAGLVKGIMDNGGDVLGALKDLFTNTFDGITKLLKSLFDYLTDESGNLEWGKIISGGMIGGLLWTLITVAKAFDGIADILGGFGDILGNTADAIEKLGKKLGSVLTGYSWDLKATALLKLAGAIAVLVASIVVLTQIKDIKAMWNAVGVIAALAGILVLLAVAMDKLTSSNLDISKNGVKMDGLKTGLIQIGLALLLMVAIVKIVGSMPVNEAKQGFIGLAALAVGLIVFVAILAGISKYAKDVGQFSTLMLKLAIAMALMVGVIKLVSGLDDTEISYGILFATGFALFVIAISKVAKTAGNNVSKVGGLMIKLAFAMALMVGVVKLVSLLSLAEMLKGAAFAAGFVVFVGLLVSATKIGKKQQIAKIGGLVLGVSFALTLMVGVCKLVSLLSYSEMLKGALFVGGFVILVKLLVSVLTIGSEQKLAKVTGTIFAMSIAIGILAAIAIMLSYVDLEGLAKGVVAVSILGLVMAAMVHGLKGANDVKGSIMMMAIAIGVMAAAIIALTFIDDTKALMTASGCLALVMGMFSLIVKNSSNINKAVPALIVMTLAVGALAGILYLLSSNLNDVNKAIAATVALSILMGALAACLKIISGIHVISWGAIGAMAVMVLILGGVATILGLMSHFNVEPSIETASALSILLLSMAAVTAILTGIGAGAPAILGGIGAFAAVIIAVGVILVALAKLNEWIPELQSWLDTGMVLLQKIGEGIGRFIGGIIGGIGEGLMDSALDMATKLVHLMRVFGVAGEIGGTINTDNFSAVGELLDILGGIALTGLGTNLADFFSEKLGGESAMTTFKNDSIAFFEAMKTIGEASTGITIDEAGLENITKAAGKLVELQSSIEPIGGLASFLLGHTDLGTFGGTIKSFIDQMKLALGGMKDFTYDTKAFASIVGAAGELATLQSSLEPIGGVISWFTGRDDLGRFGLNVCAFIVEMKVALGSLSDFSFSEESRTALKAITTAAAELATLQSSLEPIGGVISWFTGRDDLGRFGLNVCAFIVEMKVALSELTGIKLDEDALGSVIKAAEKLAELQSSLEPMNSVISWFTGRTDLGTFGTNVGLFADAMGKLKTAMGEDGISEATISSITMAGTAIIELQKVLPEESWFDGKMNLTEFSDYISDFATAMGDFAATASEIDFATVTSSINTAHKIKNLITSLSDLDTSGLATFTGVGTGGIGADGAAYKIAQAISKYAEEVAGIDTTAVTTSVNAATKLKTLIAGLVGLDTSGITNFKPDKIGDAMKTYGDKVATIDSSVVSQSITSANRLKTLITSLVGLDTSGIANFKVGTLGAALKTYSGHVAGFNADAVNKSISAANRLKRFISELSGFDSSGVGSFKTAINDLSTVNVDGIVKAFSGASVKLSTAGVKMMDSLVKGLQSKASAVKNAVINVLNMINNGIQSKMTMFVTAGATVMTKLNAGLLSKISALKATITSIASNMVNGIIANYSNIYNSGAYLGTGLVNGINSKQTAAYNAGYALGQAAVQGEKDGQASNSPSKLTTLAGRWLGEGLIIGIKKISKKVYDYSYDMGETATSAISSTVSKLSDIVSTDIDAQPTIRPVLDLSNVRTGVAAIDDMFGMGSTIGVLTKANNINATLNQNRQNGSTADVVSAIADLRKDLGKVGNTSYNINGVTYDDGSNVSDAVRTIVRAARVERRV